MKNRYPPKHGKHAPSRSRSQAGPHSAPSRSRTPERSSQATPSRTHDEGQSSRPSVRNPSVHNPVARKPERPTGRFIMGRNCVQEALNFCPERIAELYTADLQKLDDRGQALVKQAREIGILCQSRDADGLTALASSGSHQSIVALMKDDRSGDLRQLLSSCENSERACLVLLDAIGDPHNLGAILRVTECFGATGVVWSRNRGAPLSAAASKVSVGASEIVPIAQVSNLVEAARRIKDAGFWLVGAEAREGAVEASVFDFPARCALVLGSEEEGLQPLLAKQLDYRVSIKMYGRIDSLNVSQAGAVLLHEWRRKTELTRKTSPELLA